MKNFFNDKMPNSDEDLYSAFEQLEDVGDFPGDYRAKKEKVSREVFNLYIAYLAMSIWKGDGWGSVFAENHALVPYLAEAMNAVGLSGISKAVEQTVSTFPVWTDFSDGETIYDIINFMENPRRKIDNEVLLKISREEREQMCSNYKDALHELDELASPLWEHGAPQNEGLDIILEFVQKHWNQ